MVFRITAFAGMTPQRRAILRMVPRIPSGVHATTPWGMGDRNNPKSYVVVIPAKAGIQKGFGLGNEF